MSARTLSAALAVLVTLAACGPSATPSSIAVVVPTETATYTPQPSPTFPPQPSHTSSPQSSPTPPPTETPNETPTPTVEPSATPVSAATRAAARPTMTATPAVLPTAQATDVLPTQAPKSSELQPGQCLTIKAGTVLRTSTGESKTAPVNVNMTYNGKRNIDGIEYLVFANNVGVEFLAKAAGFSGVPAGKCEIAAAPPSADSGSGFIENRVHTKYQKNGPVALGAWTNQSPEGLLLKNSGLCDGSVTLVGEIFGAVQSWDGQTLILNDGSVPGGLKISVGNAKYMPFIPTGSWEDNSRVIKLRASDLQPGDGVGIIVAQKGCVPPGFSGFLPDGTDPSKDGVRNVYTSLADAQRASGAMGMGLVVVVQNY